MNLNCWYCLVFTCWNSNSKVKLKHDEQVRCVSHFLHPNKDANSEIQIRGGSFYAVSPTFYMIALAVILRYTICILRLDMHTTTILVWVIHEILHIMAILVHRVLSLAFKIRGCGMFYVTCHIVILSANIWFTIHSMHYYADLVFKDFGCCSGTGPRRCYC